MKAWTVIAVVLIVSMLAPALHAQVILPDRGRDPGLRENVFGLGLVAGPATGLGVSFRHHLPSQFSYQVAGGIIKVDNRLSYDIGLEAQFDLIRAGTGRFFVGGGAGYYFAGRSGHNEMDAPARVGVGVGGEWSGGYGIHLDLELMFTYFSDGNVLPLPQVGIHYYFY